MGSSTRHELVCGIETSPRAQSWHREPRTSLNAGSRETLGGGKASEVVSLFGLHQKTYRSGDMSAPGHREPQREAWMQPRPPHHRTGIESTGEDRVLASGWQIVRPAVGGSGGAGRHRLEREVWRRDWGMAACDGNKVWRDGLEERPMPGWGEHGPAATGGRDCFDGGAEDGRGGVLESRALALGSKHQQSAQERGSRDR